MKFNLLSCVAPILLANVLSGQFNLQWETQFNGQGDFTDKFTCLVSDASGFVYAAGYTVNPGTGQDYLITKLDNSGNLVWRKVFNAPGNGPDVVKDILVDASGKVYVTGYGNNVGTGADIYTIVLNSIGDTLFTRLYNDPLYNQYEQGNSIDVDSDGDIFIAGEGDRDVSGIINDDYLALKYSASGELLWVKRFNGTGDATDRAVSVVAVDANNIYVTGRSDNGFDDDYVTIKYNGLGVQQWMNVVDNGGMDRATGMDADAVGNIYVTGRRNNGNDDDYFTIKYSPAGNIVYSKFFDYVEDDRAEAIDVAPDGSFVITGRSDGNATAALNWNYYTVMYDALGNQVWASAYNGIADNDDWPVSVALYEGMVAVTGFSDSDPSPVGVSNNMVTVLYNSSGSAQWTHVLDGSGNNDEGAQVAFNSSGLVRAVGFVEDAQQRRDAVLVYFNSNGGTSLYTDNGVGDNTENIRDMVIGPDNSIYICGYSVGKDTDRNMCTIKLNAAGDTVWTRTLSGNLYGSDEEANSIALDNLENVIVAGYTKNSSTGSDITIIAYSPTGDVMWTAFYDGLAHEADRAYDLALDNAGNVYVTGRTDIDPLPTSNDECFTAKYLANGSLAWSHVVPGDGDGSDRGLLIYVGGSGNVYVVGRKNNGTDDDVLVVKYDAAGVLQWQQVYDGGNGDENPKDAFLDGNENLIIGASSESVPGSLIHDYLVLKYDSEGMLLWHQEYDGAGSGNDELRSIDTSGSGDIFVTGISDVLEGDDIDYNIVTLHLNSAGEITWQNEFSANGNQEDLADDIKVSTDGKIFVIGHTDSDLSENVNYDIVTYFILEDGSTGLSVEYAESDSSDVADILIVEDGSVYLGGSTWDPLEQRNKLVLKYNYIVGISEESFQEAISVFPNPVTEVLNFVFADPRWENSEVSICDVNGRQVTHAKLDAGKKRSLDLSQLTPGHYLITISSNRMNVTLPIVKK